MASIAVVAATVLLPPSPASADDGPFTIDGSVIPDAGAALLEDPSGNIKELGPKNGSSTKIGVIQDAATPMLEKTNPNAQVDLTNAWVDLKRQDGDDWVYFAWERDSNNGSGFISFEFMQNDIPDECNDYALTDAALIANCNPWSDRSGDPQPGDFLILWDQQGGSTDLSMRVWSGDPGDLTLGAPVAIDDEFGEAEYSANKFFGEAAINLTGLELTSGDECQPFANVIPSTVTGNSDSADYKDTILDTIPPISNCEATIVTTPKDGQDASIPGAGLSIGTGVVAVKDEATISLEGGSSEAVGEIEFHLCQIATGTCDTGGEPIGPTSIAGGDYPKTVMSPTAYVTSVGRYCWRAEWLGDEANGIPGTSDSASTECFTVNPVTPGLSTDAGDAVLVGEAVTDTATLSGTATDPATPVINTSGDSGPAAGGAITFTLYGPSDDGCGDLVHTTDPVTVSGDNDYTTPDPQFAPESIGTYHWVASYSGSTNNNSVTHNEACTDVNEMVEVQDVPSTLATSQSWVPNDTATLSATAGGDMNGTVTFTLYPSTDCTGTAVYTEDVDVVDGDADGVDVGTSNEAAVAAGDYSWGVSYVSTNLAQRDIAESCEETSSLTVDDGDPVSSD